MRYQQSSRFMRVGSLRTRKRATTCVHANTNLNARKLTRTERVLTRIAHALDSLHYKVSERAWNKHHTRYWREWARDLT